MHTIKDVENDQPYLIPISERARAILDSYDDRQIETRDALTEIEKLIEDYINAEKERNDMGFDVESFSIYWILKQNGFENKKELALQLNSKFQKFKRFRQNPIDMRSLRKEIYKQLFNDGITDIDITTKITEDLIRYHS